MFDVMNGPQNDVKLKTKYIYISAMYASYINIFIKVKRVAETNRMKTYNLYDISHVHVLFHSVRS